MNHTPSGSAGVSYWLWLWLACTALSIAFVALDLAKTRQARWTIAEKIERLSWLLSALYMGPFCALVYQMVRQREENSFLWKRAASRTMHCAAGQMTGMLLAAVLFSGIPRGWELVAEYFSGLCVGLLVFKAPASQGGQYWNAVASNWSGEVLAMNAMMAGQIPIMAILMQLDERAMYPSSAVFWIMMSFSFIAGAVTTYPLMVWSLLWSEGRSRPAWPRLTALMTWAALVVGIVSAYFIGYFVK